MSLKIVPKVTVHYSSEEIQKRLDAWAKLPAELAEHFPARTKAWNEYVDARDGLLEGTTAAHHARLQDNEPGRRQQSFHFTPPHSPKNGPRSA